MKLLVHDITPQTHFFLPQHTPMCLKDVYKQSAFIIILKIYQIYMFIYIYIACQSDTLPTY